MSADPRRRVLQRRHDRGDHQRAEPRSRRCASRRGPPCFAFKGKDIDVRQIGRELGVRTVLEGSVRQAGRRLRIHAQLVDVGDRLPPLVRALRPRAQDVFAVQDEIARSIAETLEPRLTGGSAAAALAASADPDVEAYDLYLKGRHFWKLRRHALGDRAVRGGGGEGSRSTPPRTRRSPTPTASGASTAGSRRGRRTRGRAPRRSGRRS